MCNVNEKKWNVDIKKYRFEILFFSQRYHLLLNKTKATKTLKIEN